MKAAKILVAFLAIVGVLAGTAWYLRDALIKRFSSPLLAEYGLTITNISLDSLARNDASIGFLELQHESGTAIVMEKLRLPIGSGSNGVKIYAASKVTVTAATDAEDAPFEMAKWIRQFVTLPNNLAGSEIVIGEFNLAPYRPVKNFHWTLAATDQALRANFFDMDLALDVHLNGPSVHELRFAMMDTAFTLRLQQVDDGVTLSGTTMLDLPAWMPIASLLGMVPEGISIVSGSAAVEFDLQIPIDLQQSPVMNALVTPASALQIVYAGSGDAISTTVAQSSTPLTIVASFPEVSWTIQQAQASLSVTYADWRNLPVNVRELSCRSGTACSMRTAIAIKSVTLPFGKAGLFQVSSMQDVTFADDGIDIAIRPEAKLHFSKLSTPDFTLALLDAQLMSPGNLKINDAGWQLSGSSVDARVEQLSLTVDRTFTAALFLENLMIRNVNEKLAVETGVFVPSSQLISTENTINAPGFSGKVSLQDETVSANLKTVGLHTNGPVTLRHNLDLGAGQLSVRDTALSFSVRTLAERIVPWHANWGVRSGTVGLGLDASWRNVGAVKQFDASATVQLTDIAGFYTDTVFAGLSTGILGSYNSVSGITLSPATLAIGLVEVGLPIEQISARYTLDASDLSVAVEDLRMVAFGGEIRADPFSFRTANERNNLTLRATSIELVRLLAAQDFEALNVVGRVSAVLPVTIEGGSVTIQAGKITGDAPGGLIRYRGGGDATETAVTGIGMATQALSNFEFDTLLSDVDYSPDGDLKLQMRLTGRNPDMQGNRPVILNLGVESNIPQMLKSLQAARAVEDILEKRLAK